MFPRNENRKKGTFACSPGTRAHSPKPPLYETALFKGIAKGGVKNRNKGGCKRLFAFVHVCSRLLAFACVFASAFACVCQRLCAFARICLRPPLLRPPLRDTDFCFLSILSSVNHKWFTNHSKQSHSKHSLRREWWPLSSVLCQLWVGSAQKAPSKRAPSEFT